MANSNQIMFMVIVAILFTMALIGIFMLINRSNDRKRELLDLEQRLHAQEKFLQRRQEEIEKCQPAMVKEIEKCQPAMFKEEHQIPHSPYVVMTPQKEKKSRRESFLHRVYGIRSTTSPFIARPRSDSIKSKFMRPPSFMAMTEQAPPAYDDHKTSPCIKSTGFFREN